MENPVDQASSETSDRSLDKVQRQVSDQLERELCQGELDEQDQSLCRQQTVSLNVSPNSVKHWNTAAAFRELFQNWKDAILKRFQLERRDFQPFYDNKRDCVSIIVPDPRASALHGHGRALGFIKYEKKAGRVILANPCASLRPDDLQLGQTSKEGSSPYLAGCRGEGLKLAAMVMSQNGYRMYMAAGGCDWTFRARGPSRSQVSCVIRPSRNANSSLPTDPASDMAQLRSRVERDITITIGPERNKKREKISLELFKQWLEISLDIRGFSYPSHIIETGVGDIILDEKFRGKVYLKGVLLSGSSLETGSYKLGYNFLTRTVNRDRQRSSDKEDEANLVRRIWEAAIGQDEVSVLPLYVNLLRDFPQAPDVELAGRLLEAPTRSLIWKHLLQGANRKLFYYSETCHAKDVDVIRDVLGKKPVKIPESLWDLLRSDSAIRTAEEEQIILFKNAPVCSPSDSSFSRTVQRVLKACMALSENTKHIRVFFIHIHNSTIDTFFDLEQQVLKIHHRWLDFDATHRGYPCRDALPNMAGPYAPFFCDHIVEELMRQALPTIFRTAPMSRATEHGVVRQIRHSLRYMPHSITSKQLFPVKGLVISWEDNEAESFRKSCRYQLAYHVVLHEERCTTAQSELLHGEAATCADGHASCGCPEQLVSQRHKVAVFADLDCSKKYFPMIALNQRSAFYGYPPEITVRGGQVEARDPADSLSIHEQQKLDMQTFPSRTQHGPEEPAARPPHAQQPHLRAQQAQPSQMARELFIRQAKRQKH